ncbi:MAG TPA: glycosyltransferase family 1 protein [Acidimicrobiales bacterium]
MSPARIGANLLWVVPGVVGGSEDYTVRLLDSFARLGEEDLALTLFVNRAFLGAHPGLADRFPVVVGPVEGTSRPARVVAEATWLARQVRAERMQVVHHLGGTMPLWSPVPGVVTIHDLQPFTHPHYFRPVKRAYLGLSVPRSVRRAVVVVTLSEFTRQDVAERMGVDPGRILIVPPGIDTRPPPDPEAVRRAREIYGLGERPFFLYPTITYPHKNHVTLVRAFARLAEVDPEPMLVLTGGVGSSEPVVQAEIRRAGVEERVVRAGRIPRSDLDGLFEGAAALTFPSHYEGFGIPVLEAMSHRLPVLASSVTALPEVVGDGGVLIDPDDVEGWTHAMALILSDPDHREELATRAAGRAARFTWKASALALAAAHRRALADIGGGR